MRTARSTTTTRRSRNNYNNMNLKTDEDGEKHYDYKKINTKNVTLGLEADGETSERTIVTNNNYTCTKKSRNLFK